MGVVYSEKKILEILWILQNRSVFYTPVWGPESVKTGVKTGFKELGKLWLMKIGMYFGIDNYRVKKQ